MLSFYKALAQRASEMQFIVITGRNIKLFANLEKLVEEMGMQDNTKLLYFVKNVEDYMHISDLIVTKPGGLTVTESLACSLPMAIYSAFPGQERDNAEFLLNKGAAIMLQKKTGADDIVNLVKNTEKLEEALKANPNAKLIYTIPNFQNPSGVTMSLEKRKKVYELAKKYGVLIIEDNPYGDLRYSGEYVPNIKSLDTDGIVIYACSFSKVISPGMRVAYTIAPKPIFQKLVVCKQGNDVHTNIWSQYVCDEFITKYDFNAHLARLREIYTKKASFCMELLDKYCAPKITYHKIDGGLFIWCDLPEDIDMPKFCRELVLKKVCVVPGNAFLTDENETCHSFRINFSTPTDEQLERGIKILGEYANSL